MVTSTPGSDRMKYCQQCGRMIQPGEDYKSYDKVSMSAAGITVHLHVACTPKASPRRRKS
jgi:hypothetical protein